jgi:hypothetical protein
MKTLISCFKKDGGQLLRELKNAVSAGDVPCCRALLHRLKGMSSTIGAVAVARLCQDTLTTSDSQLKRSGHLLVEYLGGLHHDAAGALDRFLVGGVHAQP